jgi:hypothetical protein
LSSAAYSEGGPEWYGDWGDLSQRRKPTQEGDTPRYHFVDVVDDQLKSLTSFIDNEGIGIDELALTYKNYYFTTPSAFLCWVQMSMFVKIYKRPLTVVQPGRRTSGGAFFKVLAVICGAYSPERG